MVGGNDIVQSGLEKGDLVPIASGYKFHS